MTMKYSYLSVLDEILCDEQWAEDGFLHPRVDDLVPETALSALAATQQHEALLVTSPLRVQIPPATRAIL